MVNARIFRFVMLGVLLLVGTGYAITRFNYEYIHGDEGVALMGGWRIFLGEKPYLDYLEFFPPFSFFPTALFFSIFGVNFLAERLLVLCYAILLIISADYLLSRLTKNFLPRIALAAYLVPFGVYHWPIPSHHWVITILQLLSLALLLQGLRENPARNGALAGALAALAVFTMQDQGAYLVVALLVLFFPWIEAKQTRKTLLAAWITAGGVTAAAFMIYLLANASLASIVYQTIFFPLETYKGVAGNQNTLAGLGLQVIGTKPWVESLGAFPAFTVTQTLLGIALPLSAPIALFILARGFIGKHTRNAVTGALVAGVLAFLGGALHRYTQTSLVWAAPMFLVVICWRLGRGDANAKSAANASLLAIFLCACIFCMGHYQRIKATPRVAVTGPAGTLQVPANSTQSSMQMVLDAIELHVPADAPLICTEYNPIINFWSQRRNPGPLNFYTWPKLHTDEHAREIIGVLKDNPSTHLLVFIPFKPGDPLAQYALDNYRVSWRAPWALLLSPR